MKRLLYILPLLLFLACDRQNQQDPTPIGYLSVGGIELSCEGEVIPLSRAVDAGLRVQVWQNGAMVEGKDFAPGTDFSKRIVLPVGSNYTVKAFTPKQSEAAGNEAGIPVYSVESSPFAVLEGDITTLSLIVPQINVGVGISCDNLFITNFTDISVTVLSESGRSVTIQGAGDSAFRYFTVPTSAKLKYTVKAKNLDGEAMEKTCDLPVTAKNYKIQLSI
ncbi:MAG: DUF4493 domain-containing protein [Odoribacter sp.]